MSSGKRHIDEFAVGLTVVVAVIILIGGILWGKGVSFKADHRPYYVHFSEVYGLKEGSAVLVQGVAYGKVDAVELDETGALVTILLDRSVVLYHDATVLLFAPQLMSGRAVTIDPGTGPDLLADGTRLEGSVPAGMGEVMAASGEVLVEVLGTVQQLRTTAERVDSLVVQSRMLQRVEGSLSNLESMTASLRDDLGEAATALRISAEEIRYSAQTINAMVSDNQPRLDTLMVRMNRVVGEAESFSSNLESFSNAMNSQQGSLGKLIYSNDLHDQLQTTLADLDTLIVKLKEEGVNVSIF